MVEQNPLKVKVRGSIPRRLIFSYRVPCTVYSVSCEELIQVAEKFYEILEHTADIRIRVRAKSLEDLFSQTARAVFDIIAERKPGLSSKRIEITVNQEGGNLEELFINWLNELLSLSSADGLIFSDFKIKSLNDKFLEASVFGEKSGNFNINKEVKAATYHQFHIVENTAGWKAEVILDV